MLAQRISGKLDCSTSDVMNYLYTLGDTVKDIVSDGNYNEIKIFPGLKVTSRFIPIEQSKANNIKNQNTNYSISISPKISDDFRDKVRQCYENK